MFAFLKKLREIEVFRNFSYLTVGGILSQAIGLFTLIKIAAIYSPDNYGLYTFLLIQGQLIITVGDLGIRNVIIRSIARNPEKTKELLRAGTFLKISAVVTLSALYLGYNAIWGHLDFTEVALISMFGILNCLTNLFESVFIGHQKMLPISVINITSNTIWFAFVMLLPAENISVSFLFSAFIILNLAKAIVLYWYLKIKNFVVGETANLFDSAKKLVMESWPFLSLTLLMLPVNYFSNNFLDINSSQEELGYFNLAQKLMMPINLVIGFALSAIFPNLSSLWTKNKEKFYRYITVGIKYYIISALILCFLFTLFAREVVIILFSDEYLPAIQVCQLQVWYVFLMSVNSSIGTIWASTNKEKLILKSGIINAILSTPLLFIGSYYGALGLSYGYVASFVLFEIYLWNMFKKSEQLKIKKDAIMWISAAGLFLLSYFIPQELALLYRILIAVVLGSFLALYLYKTKALAALK